MNERCNNEQDPISLDDIVEIPEKYLYKIKCGNVINCYDIRQLVHWLKTGHNKDPLCGNIIPNEIVNDIYKKYKILNNPILEILLNPKRETEEHKRETEEHQRRMFYEAMERRRGILDSAIKTSDTSNWRG